MASTIYFENSAGRIREDDGGFLRLEWKAGPRQTIDFQALLNHVVVALQGHGWSKMLADQQLMSPLTTPELAWMTGDWLPRAVQVGGYRYGAIVLAHDVFARLATVNLTARDHGLPLVYKSFEDEATAVAWLHHV